MADNRPNILLIMSDQQRLDTVSAYGLNDVCRTPNIDGLARRGVRFDRAFTPTAICSPARASILTGVYPHRHGVTGNDSLLSPDVKGMQEYLNDTGYRCGYAGKWHIDGARGPSEMGFTGKDFVGYAFPGSRVLPGLQFDLPPLNRPNHYEEYLRKHGFEPRVTKRFVGTNPTNQAQEMFALHDGPVESSIEYFVADETNRVIDEVSGGGEPFFMWANFWGPHSPSLVPEPYYSMYNPADIPEHPGYRETFENKPYRQSLIEKLWGLGDYGWKGFQEIAARYFGHCTLIDDMVGKILEHLDERGLLENTVVIYAADHGDCLGAHRLIEKGEFMYDEIYRVPFIAAHPECTAPGSTNDSFIYLHELAPTILDIAGVESHDPMDGESLKGAFLGDDTPNGRDEVYCVFDRHFTVVQQRMVRTRTHQLTFNSADQGELYDLVVDPYQLTNVYGRPEYEDVRGDLMGRMRSYMERLDDPLLGWFSRISGTY